jgi:hypothetical protein
MNQIMPRKIVLIYTVGKASTGMIIFVQGNLTSFVKKMLYVFFRLSRVILLFLKGQLIQTY